MSNLKLRTFKRWKTDDYFLDTIGEQLGLDSTAVFRMAIRDFAYRHGYALTEVHEIMLAMRDLTVGCKLAKVQGLDKTLKRAERILARHKSRIENVFRFEEYPQHIEEEILREERKLKKKRV